MSLRISDDWLQYGFAKKIVTFIMKMVISDRQVREVKKRMVENYKDIPLEHQTLEMRT